MSDELLSDLTNVEAGANKAALIRRALQIMKPDAKLCDIIDHLKREHNVEVSQAYVSNVKQQLMRQLNFQTYEALRQARKLVKEVGSIQAAKKTLDALAEEQERVAMTRNHYSTQLNEIDARLTDSNIDPKDRREIQREKQRITKLLEALEEF